jgi:hypothetical protein
MSIEVKLELELDERWPEARAIVAQGIQRAVENAVKEGAEEARRVHKYQDRTGNLTRSIQGRVVKTDDLVAEGVLEATAPYASFVENGTAPHRIEPRDAEALRWEGSDGAVHFARYVDHPGSPPFPFMGPGLLKAERVLERDIAVAIAAAEKEL